MMIGKKKCNVVPDNVIDLCSPENPMTPLTLSPIFCVKNVEKMKELEKREDCFILDFDPECPPIISKLSDKFDSIDASLDISVIAERGQVACRDYPHSRHVCLKNPFDKTPHENYCQLCYCFVCDSAAPCKMWTGVASAHCHALDNDAWRRLRKTNRGSVNKS